jgi:hypothetical protein
MPPSAPNGSPVRRVFLVPENASMKKWPIAGILLALAVGGGLYYWNRAPERTAPAVTVAPQPSEEAAPHESVGRSVPETAFSAEETPRTEIAGPQPENFEDIYSEDPAKMFKADAAGNLVLSERTRLNIEKLTALYTPEELSQRMAIIEATLPANAYSQLVDFVDRYKNFMAALRQALPPGRALTSVEEARIQHEELHRLRVTYFGEEATEAMFGREERLNRQLLELMDLEQHAGLTMEEKAMKAQELLLRSPELAATYRDAAER